MGDALIFVRFVHYSAAMLLFGLSVFDGVLLPPSMRGTRSAMRAMRALVPIVALSGIGWFMLGAGQFGDGWVDAVNLGLLTDVATRTDFGRAWTVHLLIALLLLPALVLRGSFGRWTLIALGGAMLASHAFVGHAAVQAGNTGWLHKIADMVHLVAAGFWLGSLPPLVVCLIQMRRREYREGTTLALRRFSGLGHVAVALVLISGIVNAWLTLGVWPTDFGSPYQRLLAIKIALVATMIGIALINRYAITPRLETGGAKVLAFNASAEVVLGAAVVALVSAFSAYDPV